MPGTVLKKCLQNKLESIKRKKEHNKEARHAGMQNRRKQERQKRMGERMDISRKVDALGVQKIKFLMIDFND